MISASRLSDVFVKVSDSLVAEFDVVDFLQSLAEHSVDISGAVAAGLMLADQDGSLHYMAASSERAKLLELFQLQNSQGPCLDCFRTHQPVVNTNLAQAEDRWPLFAPRAIEAGFESVHAIPLRLRDQTIGALNLFGDSSVRFEPDDVRIVQALADVATIAILQERSITRAETLTEQLQVALNSRIVIEQAKGAIAQAHDIDVDQAFELLRAHARNQQVRLTDLAHTVVTDPDQLDTLNQQTQTTKAAKT